MRSFNPKIHLKRHTNILPFSASRYHTDQEIKTSFAEIERKFPTVSSFDANENEISMNFPSVTATADVRTLLKALSSIQLMKISSFQIGSPQETKLHVLVLGSFFDASPLGRELTLNLARHVVAGYELQEPPSVRLLNNTVIHFVPFTDNFDFILSQYKRNASVCDPTIREEFADRLLSPEKTPKKKSLFLNMLETNRFDMALTFSAGGYDIQGPRTENQNSIYARSAMKMSEMKLRESHGDCALNPLRIHQTSTLQKITQMLLDSYQLPLYSIQLGCCKMPPQEQISSIWRENIHKALNFLQLTETGVKGSIQNAQSVPIRTAKVTIVENGLTKAVTKNLAYFRFILPAGQYELQIDGTDTGVQTIPINLIEGQILDLGNILLNQRHSASYQSKDGPNIGVAQVKAVLGGKIEGRILDERNHPIEGATVTLIDSKDKISNISNDKGKFRLSSTPFGTVTISVNAYGHESAIRYGFDELITKTSRKFQF